jgi:hypothetical protein
MGHEPLASKEHRDRDTEAIDELLKELAELRELDRRRQAHAPGSPGHDAATLEADLRGRRLMDRFRDFEQDRRPTSSAAPELEGTRTFVATGLDEPGSRLN